VKEGIGSFTSVSEAFGPAAAIHLGNPGLEEKSITWTSTKRFKRFFPAHMGGIATANRLVGLGLSQTLA
jgi:hypothetical protein